MTDEIETRLGGSGKSGTITIENPVDIVTVSTDRRGRFTLGNEYGGKTVTVAVVDVSGGDSDE